MGVRLHGALDAGPNEAEGSAQWTCALVNNMPDTAFCATEAKREKIHRILSRKRPCRAEFRLLPYESNPAPYFRAADLIVTKPAFTTAEAFACGKPVLAVDPLPAHRARLQVPRRPRNGHDRRRKDKDARNRAPSRRVRDRAALGRRTRLPDSQLADCRESNADRAPRRHA